MRNQMKMTDPSPPQHGVIAITGATGYIGRATMRAAQSRGFGVAALCRRPPNVPGVPFQPYDLQDDDEIELPTGCTAILHLAATTQAGSRIDIAGEVRAASRLVRAAGARSVPLIFVSSQTASPDAATDYGRAKWQVEQIMQQTTGCIIRPGLVYGGAPRGLFGQLCGLVARLPVLPAFLPPPLVQPIHVDDLASGLIRAIEQRSTGILCLAQDDAMSFTRFLRVLARDRVRTTAIFLPFPAALLALAARMAAAIPGAPDIGRIQSLYAMPNMPTLADLQRLGLRLRPLDDGMHRSGHGRRRRQLREARILLSYILRRPAPLSLLRRYVRAMDMLYSTAVPLVFPAMVEQWPFLVAALERIAIRQNNATLKQRLSCAVLIAEASPPGAQRFMRDRPVSPVTALLVMGRAVVTDSLMRMGCLVLARPLATALKALERPAQ